MTKMLVNNAVAGLQRYECLIGQEKVDRQTSQVSFVKRISGLTANVLRKIQNFVIRSRTYSSEHKNRDKASMLQMQQINLSYCIFIAILCFSIIKHGAIYNKFE